ncbi:alanine racemase [Mycobacterium sp. ITM-2016-00318]|uniref:alanine racemase n=1 Tax=Mycobacterium sp. ITM-2016-00318 TaxID=2099693 RepID=UPI000CF88E3A|nr:alanine racemase [Mycobacterium sp. ITM-2016-00318]WNG92451.1 alanine racemase [Mycobacterium sp. ITM-2016-00318]
MTEPIHATSVAALADEPLDWRFKALPAAWWGRTPAQICDDAPNLFGDGALGPVCVLREDALSHNLTTMAGWCSRRGVELAPHGKTHMAPQLLARQFESGATAVTVATVSQARAYRAFGVRDFILANEVVDAAALRWLGAELSADAEIHFVCWVDSVAGVEQMAAHLDGSSRPVDVCVEVGLPKGRTGCRDATALDAVARAAADCPALRLVGVAGYEAALGHDITPEAVARVHAYLAEVKAAMVRLAPLFETERPIATAGGSTYFDAVADVLAGDWRTVVRSGCYLTHDHGLYARTSPLRDGLRPAMEVWAQVMSRPEPGLALLTMGRRDVSFDQEMPLPLDLTGATVTKLNDQHAYLMLGRQGQGAEVGSWLRFGISHPCTTFDKWQMIPVLNRDDRVVDLIRTFF